jgi:hypothetical protein
MENKKFWNDFQEGKLAKEHLGNEDSHKGNAASEFLDSDPNRITEAVKNQKDPAGTDPNRYHDIGGTSEAEQETKEGASEKGNTPYLSTTGNNENLDFHNAEKNTREAGETDTAGAQPTEL